MNRLGVDFDLKDVKNIQSFYGERSIEGLSISEVIDKFFNDYGGVTGSALIERLRSNREDNKHSHANEANENIKQVVELAPNFETFEEILRERNSLRNTIERYNSLPAGELIEEIFVSRNRATA